jgi:formate dehydrogenase subunit beta
MIAYTEKIRHIARRLLQDNEVERVIGFSKGSLALATQPIAVSNPDDVDKLIFNSRCAVNLANYIRGLKEKVAVVAKGCDTRNIATHIIENQVKRESIYIIGVPCTGMVDKNKLSSMMGDEITKYSENQDTITIFCDDEKKEIPKQDVLKDNCRYCEHRNPVLYDELAGDAVTEQSIDQPYADVNEIESMPIEQRWAHFQELTKNCIRCYACKNACPLCYCPTCFVDESNPQWVGKGQDKTDVDTFHFLRAFHCAGRCTDCGACVEACPMNINVRDFTRKLNKDCFELFDWEAGLNVDNRPPLDAYSPNDPNDNIK